MTTLTDAPRRINLFGGPGAGKSTTAAWLFSELKGLHVPVELVTEYVKMWAYIDRVPDRYDQVYLFAKQQQHEFRLLSRGVETIVTDSPTYLSVIYALRYNTVEMAKALSDLNDMYEKDFPSLNIFLERGDKQYHQHGRWQSEQEARDIDNRVRQALDAGQIKYQVIPYNDRKAIMDYVLGRTS